MVMASPQPRIQYARTPRREGVAFCSLGDGLPLVMVPSGPWATIEIQWGVPAWRVWNERLAQHRQVIFYDQCGTGFSDPPVSGDTYQLESQLAQLGAVVDRLAHERFALFAPMHAGPTAIAFAAHYPARVSQLVLWCAYARGVEYFGEARSEVVHHALEQDWDLFTETVTHAQLGWSEAESAGRLAALMRAHVTPAMIVDFDRAARATDVAALMPLVRAPALVLHRSQLRHPELAISRRLAAGLADARLVLLDGEAVAPFVGDIQAGLDAVDEFLEPPPRAGLRQPKATAGAGLAESLSARELEVLRLLAAGLSNAEVGQKLVIAAGTVKTHTASIYSKLDVDNRTRAVAHARELGLLEP